MKMAKKIMIVDDDPNIIKMLELRLKANGYQVMGALDEMHAVKLARREKPDLILLDILMPGREGYTVIEDLKKSRNALSIPIIFLSGLPADELERRTIQFGAEDFIPKPFESEEVISKIKKILGK